MPFERSATKLLLTETLLNWHLLIFDVRSHQLQSESQWDSPTDLMSILKITNRRIQSIILSMIGLSLLLCNTWLPLPVVIEKDISTPFPCQAKGCGCRNADQCWENCCCHTDREKLAWAAKHGVEPPSWFMERMQDSDLDNCDSKSKSATGGCCCCKKKSTHPPNEPKKTRKQLLIVKQQMNCSGIGKIDNFQRWEIQLYPGEPILAPVPQNITSLCAKHDMRLSVVTATMDPRPD